MLHRRIQKGAALFLVAVLFLFAGNRLDAQEIFTVSNKAINGYDAVAFFTESKAVKGSDAISYQWAGATWYFASQENMNNFRLTPEKYMPQYGGYCAFGAAEGHKAPTKVETWTVDKGKLYFNYNLNVKKEWDKDRAALIQKANENWPTLKNEKF